MGRAKKADSYPGAHIIRRGTDHFVRCLCEREERLSAYAIAQTAMGHSLIYTCGECGRKYGMWPGLVKSALENKAYEKETA